MGVIDEGTYHARVQEFMRLSAIKQLIEKELPKGYDSEIGERSVRCSGQKQRIGIARALYHNPGFVVFDETTSSVDNLTEQEVMKALGELSGTKTLVIIARRLSTRRYATRFSCSTKGRMVGLGSYIDLATENQPFRRIADAINKN